MIIARVVVAAVALVALTGALPAEAGELATGGWVQGGGALVLAGVIYRQGERAITAIGGLADVVRAVSERLARVEARLGLDTTPPPADRSSRAPTAPL